MGCACRPRLIPSPPSAKTCNNCIIAGYHFVHQNDSVGPCGQELTFNLDDINEANLAYGGPLIYKVIDWDRTAFETAYLGEDKKTVHVITKDAAVEGRCYILRWSVRSPSKKQDDIGDVRICIKDMCVDSDCGSGQKCHRCTGECVDESVDITTGSTCENC